MKKLFVTIGAVLLTACAGNSQRVQYLILPPDTPATLPNLPARTGEVYVLRNLKLPNYLDSQYIIFIDAQGDVIIDPNKRWVQEPQDNISRILQQQLASQLAVPTFYAYPVANNIRATRLLDVQILDMIGDMRSKVFRVRVNWQVSSAEHNNPPNTNNFSRDYPLTDTTIKTLLNTYSIALGDIARAIAPTLTTP